jgi:hypothetical protein
MGARGHPRAPPGTPQTRGRHEKRHPPPLRPPRLEEAGQLPIAHRLSGECEAHVRGDVDEQSFLFVLGE